MELDLSRPWRLVLADPSSPSGIAAPEDLARLLANPESAADPARFAAAELASSLGRIASSPIVAGEGSEAEGLILLDAGPEGLPRGGAAGEHGGAGGASGAAGADGGAGGQAAPDAAAFAAPARRGFAWRASPTRVELHGDSPEGLLACVYDFLEAGGFRWIEPGPEGERLPAPGSLRLERASGRSDRPALRPVLILGHGAYLEKAADYLLFAARNGYAGVFLHTIEGPLALGACPAARLDGGRASLAALAGRLGLELEEGGHLLSSLLPRSLSKREPELFRMTRGGRKADRNFCPSNPRSLALAAESFARFAKARPEVRVFHCWPDDLPGGGWCSCPACVDAEGGPLSAAAQSLKAALALASALAEARPGARLSFLAYHDTEELAGALKALGLGEASLPGNLELLWAPRRRSWASGYGESGSALNAASRGAFETALRDFAAAPGGASVFEYYEDALLFKGAVPPLGTTMAADLAWYSGESPDSSGARASKVGILLTGGRLPLAPRPNLWLFPRLAALGPGGPAALEALLADWAGAAYGQAAAPMLRYWKALEAAWAIDLDLEPGETENRIPAPLRNAVQEPPADWGDPWLANAERLGQRRGRCEALFDLLREAEAALAEAAASDKAPSEAVVPTEAAPRRQAKAALREREEYAFAEAVLELDSARLAAYHELASGERRAAADLSLLARSALDGLYRAARALPDRRARRELRFLGFFYYDLRLRSIRRGAALPFAKALGFLCALAELFLRGAGLLRLWERSAPGRRN